MIFIGCWMFVVYFPPRPLRLGHRRHLQRRLERQGPRQGDRLRRRHRGPHVVRLLRPGAGPSSWASAPAGAKTHFAPPQHGVDLHRRRAPLGRLVRIQRGSACARRHRPPPTPSPPRRWPPRSPPSSGPRSSSSSRARRRSSASAPARSPGWSSSTPACGFVTPDGAMIIGVIAGTDSVS